ncbi:hypothetical protein PFAG_05572 [Plasmodium falciparum Santa Lucia]|uniref:Condensin-2 complex subunit G2 n=2 Tax=Plasmodium falciparum TaxID=5833 RepID=A0A024VZY3_PLAFA|nr:hypothetical protein PFTANZ_05459 [Plasmodium falciparum Tanzania (2000708)]EUT78998.1 hypothetical protein PFAG_05572 [Plasmodium falciparum Santa Lucia]
MNKDILDNIKELPQFKLLCKKKSDLLKYFESCNRNEYDEIWMTLHTSLVEYISADNLIYDEEKSTLLFKEENNRQYLLTSILFVSIYLQYLHNKTQKKGITFEDDFQILFCKLIEIQFMLSDKEVRLSFGKCLLTICELNIKENEFTNNVKINLLLYLLWKCCHIEGKGTDITKLKKFKDFCKYINWGISERTTDSFYILCSYTLNLPKFYETSDGKIFLSHVWSQNESIAYHLFNKFVHNTAVLAHNHICHYSEIIYSTWRNCEEDMKEILYTQIEYLVNFSLKCPIKIAARFRDVLSIFHTNKGDKDINRLIFKIYDPVIWRSLMCPNWKIRFNATCIFQLIYPVVDPGIKDINYLQEMEKAYNALLDLSEDKNTYVLQATAKCICYILSELWEIISHDKRMKLIDILINKFLKEKCNECVRVEVVLGFCEMSKNPMIRKIILKIFDRIKYLINDNSLRVRKNFIMLILDLQDYLKDTFSYDIDFNELIKKLTKDFITFNVQSCIKKMSYMKYEYHDKLKNKEMYEYLKLSTNLISYSIWKCDIKEQAMKCINLLNEYPVLMICISKFSTNVNLIDRYKLSSVLFEITNSKLKEENNFIMLNKTNQDIEDKKDKYDKHDKQDKKDKYDKHDKHDKQDKQDKYLIMDKNDNKNIYINNNINIILESDSNLKKRYIRYSTLLICIANFLKPRNEEEIELCYSEEIEEFLKIKFKELYFVESINTIMQPFYFKVLKNIYLDYDNYYMNIHTYSTNELNNLYTMKNLYLCKTIIIPLFYKWKLLNIYIIDHLKFLNISMECIIYNINKCISNVDSHYYHLNIDKHTFQVIEQNVIELINTHKGYNDNTNNNVNTQKRHIHHMSNIMLDYNELKDASINKQKELNCLIFLSLVVKKKKYHHILFKPFPYVIYNIIHKFNNFLLHIFYNISLHDFELPSHFLSAYYKGGNKKNDTENLILLILYNKKEIKLYIHIYVSFFFLFHSYCTHNNILYEWTDLIQNTSKCIEHISNIKFKNEIQLKLYNVTSREDIHNKDEQQNKMKWANYTSSIIYLITYFLDMVEYTISMKMISIDEVDINIMTYNLFLFYKCYEIVCDTENEIKLIYFTVWYRIYSFIICMLNLGYFEKKTEIKLAVLNTFFLFTYEFVPNIYIENFMKKFACIIKEKDIFQNFLSNFKNNSDVLNYMSNNQRSKIQQVIDKIIFQKEKIKNKT